MTIGTVRIHISDMNLSAVARTSQIGRKVHTFRIKLSDDNPASAKRWYKMFEGWYKLDYVQVDTGNTDNYIWQYLLL